MTVTLIEKLLAYGRDRGLIDRLDIIPARNAFYDLFRITPEEARLPGCDLNTKESIQNLLDRLIDAAYTSGIITGNSVWERDLFEGRIMGILTPRQSEVNRRFWEEYSSSPESATAYLYALSRNLNYIKTERISRDLRWKTADAAGEFEITINLSKPEKDPREIAAERAAAYTAYPKCLLCAENAGFSGNSGRPARQNLRMVPLSFCAEEWYIQYSPYSYFNEHLIALSAQHRPMSIERATFRKLLAFVEIFPHYFIGSNADLPIVGGSILSHDHFQGGRHVFPVERAECFAAFTHRGYPNTAVQLLKWPLPVLRLSGDDPATLARFAADMFEFWRDYSDSGAGVLAYTGKTRHNTVTPIARRRADGCFECDLILRNNRTDADHPFGIFHPRESLHHIKRENIGLIEAMGLAVLPGRLRASIDKIAALLAGIDAAGIIGADHPLYPHAEWIEELIGAYGCNNSLETAQEILRRELGRAFGEILSDAGVFKQDEEGRAHFVRFAREFGCK